MRERERADPSYTSQASTESIIGECAESIGIVVLVIMFIHFKLKYSTMYKTNIPSDYITQNICQDFMHYSS